jgi:hypothetical protein
VLTDDQQSLLRAAREGRLECPECWERLSGKFISLPEVFVGVLLYCEHCPYTEAVSAP